MAVRVIAVVAAEFHLESGVEVVYEHPPGALSDFDADRLCARLMPDSAHAVLQDVTNFDFLLGDGQRAFGASVCHCHRSPSYKRGARLIAAAVVLSHPCAAPFLPTLQALAAAPPESPDASKDVTTVYDGIASAFLRVADATPRAYSDSPPRWPPGIPDNDGHQDVVFSIARRSVRVPMAHVLGAVHQAVPPLTLGPRPFGPIWPGGCLTDLVLAFRKKTMRLLYAVLLSKRVMFVGRPASSVGNCVLAVQHLVRRLRPEGFLEVLHPYVPVNDIGELLADDAYIAGATNDLYATAEARRSHEVLAVVGEGRVLGPDRKLTRADRRFIRQVLKGIARGEAEEWVLRQFDCFAATLLAEAAGGRSSGGWGCLRVWQPAPKYRGELLRQLEAPRPIPSKPRAIAAPVAPAPVELQATKEAKSGESPKSANVASTGGSPAEAVALPRRLEAIVVDTTPAGPVDSHSSPDPSFVRPPADFEEDLPEPIRAPGPPSPPSPPSPPPPDHAPTPPSVLPSPPPLRESPAAPPARRRRRSRSTPGHRVPHLRYAATPDGPAHAYPYVRAASFATSGALHGSSAIPHHPDHSPYGAPSYGTQGASHQWLPCMVPYGYPPSMMSFSGPVVLVPSPPHPMHHPPAQFQAHPWGPTMMASHPGPQRSVTPPPYSTPHFPTHDQYSPPYSSMPFNPTAFSRRPDTAGPVAASRNGPQLGVRRSPAGAAGASVGSPPATTTAASPIPRHEVTLLEVLKARAALAAAGDEVAEDDSDWSSSAASASYRGA